LGVYQQLKITHLCQTQHTHRHARTRTHTWRGRANERNWNITLAGKARDCRVFSRVTGSFGTPRFM